MDYKNLFVILLIGFLVWYFVFRDKPEIPAEPAPEAAVAEEPAAAATPVAAPAAPTVAASASTSIPVPAGQVASAPASTPAATPSAGRAARTPRPTPSQTLPLTRFITIHMDRIFVPLDSGKLGSNTPAELKKVQDTLRDRKDRIAQPTEKEKRLFALANTICKQFQTAINERDLHLERLESKKNAPTPTPGSRKTTISESQIQSDREREKYFMDGVRKAWDVKAKQLKQEIEKNIEAFRELERQ